MNSIHNYSQSYRHPLQAMAVAVCAALAVSAAAKESAVLRAGVLVENQRVYAMAPDGGINAIAINNGDVDWHSDAADRPVMFNHGKLLAQRDAQSPGALSLVQINSATGVASRPATVALPDDVLASVGDRMDSRFELSPEFASAADGGALVWRHTYQLMRGAQLADAVSQPRRAAGVIAVADDDDGALRVSGTSRAAPARVAASRTAKVAFAGDDRAFYAEDRRHVLVSKRIEQTTRYAWRVYDLDGGELGKFEAPASFSPFVVRDGLLLTVTAPREVYADHQVTSEPLMLRAFELGNGNIAWSQPIRDTRYAGPYPP